MKENDLYPLFNILSRIIIVFSILVLIVGLITKFNQNKPKNLPYKMPTVLQERIKVSTVAAELNLKGPFVCHFSTPEATMSGYIKDKKAYVQIQNVTKTSNMLLNGDCIYFWQSNLYTGEKFCGLSPYIPMIERLPLTSLIGNKQFSQNQSNFPIKLDTVLPALNSCKKEEIKDERIFDVPNNVIFKNK